MAQDSRNIENQERPVKIAGNGGGGVGGVGGGNGGSDGSGSPSIGDGDLGGDGVGVMVGVGDGADDGVGDRVGGEFRNDNGGDGVGAGGGKGARNAGEGQPQIDTSRVKEREENNQTAQSGASNGDNGGGATGPGPGVLAQGGMAQDSLNLLQLKKLVGDGGIKVVQPEYAYVYAPTDTLISELNEWFSYTTIDLTLLVSGTKQTFESTYTKLSLPPYQAAPRVGKPSKWVTSKNVKCRRYISRCLDLLEQADQEVRVKGLEGLSYIAQGVYGEVHDEKEQLAWIKRNNKLLRNAAVTEGVFNCVRKALAREWEFGQQAAAAVTGSANGYDPEEFLNQKAWNRRELKQGLTILYFLIEVTRQVSDEVSDPENVGMDEELESFREEIAQLPGDGGILGYLLRNISRMRWEDNTNIPLTHMLILAWKAALLLFGTPDRHLPKVKRFARVSQGLSPEVDKKVITANPLDYYLFRQDLIAKYPAYNPPKPLFAFDSNSFLPSLATHESSVRPGGNTDVLLGGKGGGENLASILEKAVHIATPAPSPPPSPINAGKGQKKQNYQTNQNFPFLYPPANDKNLDDAGCWWRDDDGGGVPKSIKEAGDLFSGRTRTSLAMKLLWQEREAFEKYGRGWEVEPSLKKQRWEEEDRIPRWEEKRLAAVDEVYQNVLPQLQSLVYVLFKVILQSIPAGPVAPPPPPPPPPQNTFSSEDRKDSDGSRQVIIDPATGDVNFGPSASLRNSWNIFSKRRGGENSSLGTIGEDPIDPVEWEKQMEKERLERETAENKHWDEVDANRSREIASKAVTALLLVLLKWFRVSHVLKAEYLTQLLLDSNYIPLVLKLFNQQDVQAALTTKTDLPERQYFRICNLHSLSPQPLNVPSSTESSSPDEACPPPIRMHRGPPPSEELPPPPETPPNDPPEVITDVSWRNFFASINIMRVLQKVVKGKAHRNLALVQYKSSVILRKPLKCPQAELRLYTLKIYKGQVPYCGRKWRQSNMRVITSIYLHCRPELRDDWLAGGDIDQEVEDALPQEQALRALTHFYNIRYFPKSMGVDDKLLDEEHDFFRRELEKMDVFGNGIDDIGVGDCGLGDGGGGSGGVNMSGAGTGGGGGGNGGGGTSDHWAEGENGGY